MSSFDMPTMISELSRDEGREYRIYKDTVGKITGGVGRNLSDVPFSDDEIDLMLGNDIDRACAGLDKSLPWWRSLDPVRQRVMINMAFNLGVAGLMTFVNTLNFIKSGAWDSAANGMLNSKWAMQVGARAQRLAQMMRTGETA